MINIFLKKAFKKISNISTIYRRYIRHIRWHIWYIRRYIRYIVDISPIFWQASSAAPHVASRSIFSSIYRFQTDISDSC